MDVAPPWTHLSLASLLAHQDPESGRSQGQCGVPGGGGVGVGGEGWGVAPALKLEGWHRAAALGKPGC